MKRLIESIERIRGRVFRLDAHDPRLSRSPPRFPLEGRRVLVTYLFSGLGDAALLAPAVKALLDAGAAAPIGLVVPKSAARLFEVIDLPVQVLPFVPGEEAAAKLERKVRARKFQIAIDLSLRDGLDARRFLAASGAEVKLGWLRAGETLERAGLDFGAPDVRSEAALHWSRYCVMPLAPLGVVAPSFDVTYAPPREAAKKARALWGRGARLLLVPGGRDAQKRWDEARFVSLGRHALARGATVVVAGAPSESKLVRAIVRGIAGRGAARSTAVAPYTGKDLGVLVELVRASDAVVSNDTGPMHLAFALSRPTIAIFAHMSSLVWGPPRNDPRFVVINARAGTPESTGDDAWTRLARHHLDKLLDAAGRR